MMYNQKIDGYLDGLFNQTDSIGEDRKNLLGVLAGKIADALKDWSSCNVVFICTHNSRRSQIAELFFRICLRYHAIEGLHGYSGGTESTAFNPSAVEACRSKGVTMILKEGSIANHTYMSVYKYHKDVIRQFSKKYDDPHNPSSNLVAVMVCDHAAENCPVIFGAQVRFNLEYVDPKIADGTANEKKVYEDKVDEIALEMMFLSKLIKNLT